MVPAPQHHGNEQLARCTPCAAVWLPLAPFRGRGYRSHPDSGRIEQPMSDVTTIQVGQQVPDFTLTTYEPTTNDFGSYSLAKAKKDGKWTLLFFYPADYTFV